MSCSAGNTGNAENTGDARGADIYRYLLFDLDGTLTDPGLGITDSIIYALKKLEIAPPERSELYRFIGPPLYDSFTSFLGMSEEGARQAITYYREYFLSAGIFENAVYDGVIPLLAALESRGYNLIMATSKPEPFAVRIASHFGFDSFFKVIAGADLDGERRKKADVISYALKRAGSPDKKLCLMIGDRAEDIRGAAENGIACAGVLHGYGSRAELTDAGADFIIDDIPGLSVFLGL